MILKPRQTLYNMESEVQQLSPAGIDAVTNEILKSHRSDIDRLDEAHRANAEKIDKKVDKEDLSELKDSVEKISTVLASTLKYCIGIVGVATVTICSFFWFRTEQLNEKMNEYQMQQYEFQLKMSEQSSDLDKRTSVIETQLKSLKLID